MKSILFAFLLIIVPIVGNATPVGPDACTGLPETTSEEGEKSCNETPGCEWSALGGCGLCKEKYYNNGTEITECPDNYLSDPGSTVKEDCYMKCGPKEEVENGSWEPDEDKVNWSEDNKQCTYENVDNLTCNTGYHKEVNTPQTEADQTDAKCVSNEMSCADAWTYSNSKKTIQYKNTKDEGLSYNNSDDKTVSFLPDKKAIYNTNNDTGTWDFTACTGEGTLYFKRNEKQVGNADVTITGTADAEWIINITGQGACNKDYCCSGNTFCDVAPKGYYLTENNTACTLCPMGTTSDPGKKSVTKCHTTESTRFVDNKGNSFSIADLFGGDITLNVVTK